MSRNGTCKHTYQIQEMYSFAPEELEQAMSNPERFKVVDTSDRYLCTFVTDMIAEMPPPVARRNSFDLRKGDCDKCAHYQPVMQVKL